MRKRNCTKLYRDGGRNKLNAEIRYARFMHSQKKKRHSLGHFFFPSPIDHCVNFNKFGFRGFAERSKQAKSPSLLSPRPQRMWDLDSIFITDEHPKYFFLSCSAAWFLKPPDCIIIGSKNPHPQGYGYQQLHWKIISLAILQGRGVNLFTLGWSISFLRSNIDHWIWPSYAEPRQRHIWLVDRGLHNMSTPSPVIRVKFGEAKFCQYGCILGQLGAAGLHHYKKCCGKRCSAIPTTLSFYLSSLWSSSLVGEMGKHINLTP